MLYVSMPRKRARPRLSILLLALLLAIAGGWFAGEAWRATRIDEPPLDARTQSLSLESPSVPQPPAPFTYEVQRGDTLSTIFSRHGFSPATLQAVLAADEELLALDVLRPGDKLQFELAGGELATLALLIRPGRTIFYRRAGEETFEFEDVIAETQWRQRILSGRIDRSFYLDARHSGLSDGDIMRARRVLEERVSFRRDLRPGDRFDIVLGEEETTSAVLTGQTRIEGLRLRLGARELTAFLHDDGNYYDAAGESLTRAFLRYPVNGQRRVSSHFNPRRMHPITRRVAPHHGVDFALPVGTPVVSTGDGIVTRVGNHPFAGRYVEIEHPGQFKTRYLHLSRVTVHRGQPVRRGDRVALSGNTGRSTGPHLHFELHVRNRPVDPLKADIPTASRVPKQQLATFNQRVETLLAAMNGEAWRLAQQRVQTATTMEQ